MKLILFCLLFSTNASALYKEVIEYIQLNSITSKIEKKGLTQQEKNFINNRIQGKKFVFLGEPDHYFEEKYAYRLKFIECLLSKGYTHILDEMGVSDGEMVQKYLETGDEDFLKKVGLYGFKYGMPLQESERNFAISSKRYIRKLRALKQKYPQLTYGGFDLDMAPGTAYIQLDKFFINFNYAFLAQLKYYIEASKVRAGNQQLLLLKKAHKVYLSLKDKLFKKIGNMPGIQFDLIFRNLVKSVELREKFKSSQDFYKIFDWREKEMFKNMTARFKLDLPKQKYILLGHNGHLTKTVNKYMDLGGVQQWYAIGSWINDKFPEDVFAIWSLIGQGEHSGHGCSNGQTCYFTAPKTTLEYDLLKVEANQTLLFSTNHTSFKNSKNLIKFLENGLEIFQGPIHKQADAIYFIPNVNDLIP